jgi:hypothetical protein
MKFIIFQQSSFLMLAECLQKLLKMLSVSLHARVNPLIPTVWYTEVFLVVTSCSLTGGTNISEECSLWLWAKKSKVLCGQVIREG